MTFKLLAPELNPNQLKLLKREILKAIRADLQDSLTFEASDSQVVTINEVECVINKFFGEEA